MLRRIPSAEHLLNKLGRVYFLQVLFTWCLFPGMKRWREESFRCGWIRWKEDTPTVDSWDSMFQALSSKASGWRNSIGRSSDSFPYQAPSREVFPVVDVVVCLDVAMKHTAAGLSGIRTRFPFNWWLPRGSHQTYTAQRYVFLRK